MSEVLYGDKLYLRPMTTNISGTDCPKTQNIRSGGDTDCIVKWRNNPRVRNNFIFRQTFTCKMHEEWIKDKVLTGNVIQYIICDRTSDRAIGSVYFRDINRDYQSAEIGIFIGEDEFVGKGYGTEAMRLFIRYGLETLGFHRISLRVLKSNENAYRCYLSCGFVKEGIFRDMVFLDGKYEDVVFMAVLKE